MNAFTVAMLSLLLVPMSLVANGTETNSVRSLMGIKLGEHEDFIHSPCVVDSIINSLINGWGNFRKGKDGDLDCRITESWLQTPFKFFDRICVYSTPDTRVIYKIELPFQATATPDEFFRLKSGMPSKTKEIVDNFRAVQEVLAKKYGESYMVETKEMSSERFEFPDSEMRLDVHAPIVNGINVKEDYFISVKLSLVDTKLVQHVKEATRKAIETKILRQKFIDDGGLL